MKDVLLILSGIGVLIYLLLLIILSVLPPMYRHECENPPKRRIDYVFPARTLSCYLYEDIQ